MSVNALDRSEWSNLHLIREAGAGHYSKYLYTFIRILMIADLLPFGQAVSSLR